MSLREFCCSYYRQFHYEMHGFVGGFLVCSHVALHCSGVGIVARARQDGDGRPSRLNNVNYPRDERVVDIIEVLVAKLADFVFDALA